MDMGLMTGCYKVGERMSPKKSSPLYHIHVIFRTKEDHDNMTYEEYLSLKDGIIDNLYRNSISHTTRQDRK
ncbi:hypothetical protein KUCAC02_009053 [Chaenocephalus aceratus]|uniref:Uncharacterized protein n=1 Tax=Chaenocephalus aceratus TaxID=36190 RepID=A0ACB9WTW0_CHAAC|nr:hypothetical protein KUCAC02_009053 [Chaenocephalus aceratus]